MGFSLFSDRKSAEGINAIELLKADHARVKELFKAYTQLEEAKSPDFVDVATMACLDLMVHSKLEKEIFYPAVEEAADEELKELLAEAEVEHETIDLLVEKLATQKLDEETFKANFKVVQEYVEHHVKEEEDEMFPKVAALNLNLDALADRMRKRETQLVEEIAADSSIATVGAGKGKSGSQASAGRAGS